MRDDLISDVGGTGESLYEGTEFTNTTNAQNALDDKITPALETITVLENLYEERADHLASWADNLSSQADVLELPPRTGASA